MLSINPQTLELQQSKILHDAKALLDLAEKEGRALTADEEKAHEAQLKSLDDISGQLARVKRDDDFREQFKALTGGQDGTGQSRFIISPAAARKSLGQQ